MTVYVTGVKRLQVAQLLDVLRGTVTDFTRAFRMLRCSN